MMTKVIIALANLIHVVMTAIFLEDTFNSLSNIPGSVQVQMCVQKSCGEAEFDYDSSSCYGPSNWGSITSCWMTCNNQLNGLQSPVMIRTEQAIYNPDLPAIYINNWKTRVSGKVKNSGHACQFDTASTDLFIVNPPGRRGIYVFSTVHVHIGEGNSKETGSEHALNDRFYPMEAHMIFYNSKYTLEQAKQSEDGLVVISTFIEVEDNSNYGIFDILRGKRNEYRATVANSRQCTVKFAKTLDFLMRKYYRTVQRYSNPAQERRIIEGLSLYDILPYTDTAPEPLYHEYFTYRGSLTTPPCYQSVQWVVMACPIRVSQEAYRQYSQVHSSHHEPVSHYGIRRPIQRNLGPEVQKSFQGSCTYSG